MKATCQSYLFELEEQLKFISLETDNRILMAELSIQVIQKVLQNLKSFIVKYKFKNSSEEITFFKELKPLFHSKLIYHLQIYNIESKRPNGGCKIIKKYLANELFKLKNFFDDNLEFYKYFRTDSKYLDHKYFVRGRQDIRLTIDCNYFESDNRYSTTHDALVSKILANDRLQVYLEDELQYLERKDPLLISQDVPKEKLTWQDSKTALIELIYAFQSQGVFGNQTDIKVIAAYFENVFNIDLGDYYRTYLEIRIRKTGRTKFLSSLQQTLIKRMDQADEK